LLHRPHLAEIPINATLQRRLLKLKNTEENRTDQRAAGVGITSVAARLTGRPCKQVGDCMMSGLRVIDLSTER